MRLPDESSHTPLVACLAHCESKDVNIINRQWKQKKNLYDVADYNKLQNKRSTDSN